MLYLEAEQYCKCGQQAWCTWKAKRACDNEISERQQTQEAVMVKLEMHRREKSEAHNLELQMLASASPIPAAWILGNLAKMVEVGKPRTLA